MVDKDHLKGARNKLRGTGRRSEILNWVISRSEKEGPYIKEVPGRSTQNTENGLGIVGSLSVGEDCASAQCFSSSSVASSAYTLLIAHVLSVPRKIGPTLLAVGIFQLNYEGRNYQTR